MFSVIQYKSFFGLSNAKVTKKSSVPWSSRHQLMKGRPRLSWEWSAQQQKSGGIRLDSRLFSFWFVGTTCHNRDCMKMGNHDRPQFGTFGFTSTWTVPYLSPVIHYRGSVAWSSTKSLVLATEVHCTLCVHNTDINSWPQSASYTLEFACSSPSAPATNISYPFHVSVSTYRTEYWRHVPSNLLDQSVQIVASFQRRLFALYFPSRHVWIINGYWMTIPCTCWTTWLHSPRTAAACHGTDVRSKWLSANKTNFANNLRPPKVGALCILCSGTWSDDAKPCNFLIWTQQKL
jgi:hypothetical protein